MKALLIFKLPEDREEYFAAFNGMEYKIALEEMDEYLRKRVKYEDLPGNVSEALFEARKHLASFTNRIDE